MSTRLKQADWRLGTPSPEMIAAHAKTYPDGAGAWWLCRALARSPKSHPGEAGCTVLSPERDYRGTFRMEWTPCTPHLMPVPWPQGA